MIDKIPQNINYSTTEVVQDTTRWIIAQRDNISLAIKTNTLEVSVDNSQTWGTSTTYADYDKIQSAHIFRNGNILLQQNDNKLILTDYTLSSTEEISVYDSSGSLYTPHTPANASYPGAYYYTHRYTTNTDETDVYCWGNYGNVNQGATPTNIYYTTDYGKTVKIAYEFGQNSARTDDGTSSSGTGGTLLGDSGNSVVTKHTHCVEYNPNTDKWYCFTGDTNVTSPANDEIHWLEGTYTSSTDSWSWSVLNFGASIEETSKLKSVECFFHDGWLYYCADATNVATSNDENGIWRVPDDSITDLSKHQKIYDTPDYDDFIGNMKLDRNTGFILFVISNIRTLGNNSSKIGIIKDYGFGDVGYKDYGSSYEFIRLSQPNQEGYFRLCTDKFTTNQGQSFLIKAGDDLFDNL
jgi:hypothetical protein